jgi:hypothetical protein
LYLISASPIISRRQNRYLGALLVGRQLNSSFAQKRRASLGKDRDIELAFFLRGTMVASTTSSTALKGLAAEFSKHRAQIAKNGRTEVIDVRHGGDVRHRAVLAPIPGEASSHNAFYAVIGKPIPSVDLSALLDRVTRTDLLSADIPWPVVGGVFGGVLILGLLIVSLEWARPTRRLIAEMSRIAAGDQGKLDEVHYGGRLHLVARRINEALERFGRRGRADTRDVNKILGPPDDYLTRPDLRRVVADISLDVPSVGRGAAPLTDLDHVIEPPADLKVIVKPAASSHSGATDAEEAVTDAQTGIHVADDRALALDLEGDAPFRRGVEPMPIPDSPDSPEMATEAEDEQTLASPKGRGPVDDQLLELDEGIADGAQHEFSGHGSSATVDNLALDVPHFDGHKGTRVNPSSAPEPATTGHIRERSTTTENLDASGLASTATQSASYADDDVNRYYRQVFDEFVLIKQQCGESTEKLTFEKFSAKLDANRSTLVEKFNCRFVKFQVYVKDGKAALKATPVNKA